MKHNLQTMSRTCESTQQEETHNVKGETRKYNRNTRSMQHRHSIPNKRCTYLACVSTRQQGVGNGV
jgi:hypothetical protein